MSEKKPHAFDFEKALADLNTLVEQMERGDLPLEQSLTLFEQGIGLTRDCQKALKSAQQKVHVLLEKQGKLVLEDFDVEDETN